MSGHDRMEEEFLKLLSAQRGHFQLESGHHGDLWLDLNLLFLDPNLLRPFARELALRLSKHDFRAIVGPLVGGAFLAQMLAEQLGIQFCFAEPVAQSGRSGLYPLSYRVPETFHGHLRGKNVAIVDDAINAGSAVRGTFQALKSLGANPVAIGSLCILSDRTSVFFETNNLKVERIAFLSNSLWEPANCPLCASHAPLENFTP